MSDEKPEYITEGDGYADIELASKATIDGQEVTSLRMREPRGVDLKIAQNSKGTDADKEFRLFANLLEVSPSDIEGLTLRNLRRVQETFKFFRGGAEPE